MKVTIWLLSVIVQFRGTYLMSNFFSCKLVLSSLLYLNLLVPITSKVQFFFKRPLKLVYNLPLSR